MNHWVLFKLLNEFHAELLHAAEIAKKKKAGKKETPQHTKIRVVAAFTRPGGVTHHRIHCVYRSRINPYDDTEIDQELISSEEWTLTAPVRMEFSDGIILSTTTQPTVLVRTLEYLQAKPNQTSSSTQDDDKEQEPKTNDKGATVPGTISYTPFPLFTQIIPAIRICPNAACSIHIRAEKGYNPIVHEFYRSVSFKRGPFRPKRPKHAHIFKFEEFTLSTVQWPGMIHHKTYRCRPIDNDTFETTIEYITIPLTPSNVAAMTWFQISL
jgi:hypothetical protein